MDRYLNNMLLGLFAVFVLALFVAVFHYTTEQAFETCLMSRSNDTCFNTFYN